jgi:hypothetical protein
MASATTWRRNFVMTLAILICGFCSFSTANAATFSVKMTPGTTENPLNLNQTVQQYLTASLSGTLANGQEVQFVSDSEDWAWNIAPTGDDNTDKITYNASASAGLSSLPTNWGSASVVGTDPTALPSTTSSQATLTVTGNQSGYYHIPIVASVDFQYIDPSTGNQVSGHAFGVINILIVVQAGDFYINVSPSSVTLPEGGNNSGTNNGGPATVTITSQNGMTGNVALSLSNSPIGVSGQFNPDSTVVITTPNSSDDSHNLTLFVGNSTTVGQYPLHVHGDWTPNPSLDVSYYSLLNLTVQKPGVYLTCSEIEPSVSKSGPDNRNSDGSITVDSLAHFNTNLSSGRWYGPGATASNAYNITTTPTLFNDVSDSWTYSNPNYVWIIPSSSAGTPTYITQSFLGTGALSSTSVPFGMNLSPDPPSGFPVTTSIQATVTDNLPPENVSATNIYTIRWHLPVENFGPPTTTPNNDYIGDLTPIDINLTQTVNIPGKEADATFGATGQAQDVGLVVATGGALAPFVSLSEPAIYIIQALCAGTSYQLGLTPENNTTEAVQGIAKYPEWRADINKQFAENQTGSTDRSRFQPASEANIIHAQLQSNDANWNLDPYFMNASAEWMPGRYANDIVKVGDAYGVNGYTGPSPSKLHVQGVYFIYFLWTSSYRPH